MQFVLNKCDFLISLDANLQQDEYAIIDFVGKYLEGSEVVLGIGYDKLSDAFSKSLQH